MYSGVWLRLELGLVLFDKHVTNIFNEWLGKISCKYGTGQQRKLSLNTICQIFKK